jgi:hypothetical protein
MTNPVFDALNKRGTVFLGTTAKQTPKDAPLAVWEYGKGDALIFTAMEPDDEEHHDGMTCEVVARNEGFEREDGAPIWTHGSFYFVHFPSCGCRIAASSHKLRGMYQAKYRQ